METTTTTIEPLTITADTEKRANMTRNLVADGALLERLQPYSGYLGGNISDHRGQTSMLPTPSILSTITRTPTLRTASVAKATASSMVAILIHFLPTASTSPPYINTGQPKTLTPSSPLPLQAPASTQPQQTTTTATETATTVNSILSAFTTAMPTTTTLTASSSPSIANLVVNANEDLSNFRDVTFDMFDEDSDLYGSPLAFDASENGLWNGRFVPPPPRPPFLVDDAVLSDGLTTCDLCSWAMPTKSTFIFEGTIEKASELGWPLTLIIVSILSAILGAIIMVIVVRCRRKKATNNRNATHVQWWSRNKRPSNNNSNNNNHLRRSNIYTAHPADSIRGLQHPSLSAASSLTAITAMGGAGITNATMESAATNSQQHQQQQTVLEFGAHHPQQQQQQHLQHSQYHHSHRTHIGPDQIHQHHYIQSHAHLHHRHNQHQQQHQRQHMHVHHHPEHLMQQESYSYDDNDFDHEYDEPQQLHLHHQRQQNSSLSTSSVSSPSPALTLTPAAMMPIVRHNQQLQHQPQQHSQHYFRDVTDTSEIAAAAATATSATATAIASSTSCHWPNATMLLAS